MQGEPQEGPLLSLSVPRQGPAAATAAAARRGSRCRRRRAVAAFASERTDAQHPRLRPGRPHLGLGLGLASLGAAGCLLHPYNQGSSPPAAQPRVAAFATAPSWGERRGTCLRGAGSGSRTPGPAWAAERRYGVGRRGVGSGPRDVAQAAERRPEGAPTALDDARPTSARDDEPTPEENQNTLVLGITSALLFGAYVLASQGAVAGAEWFSCYILEYSLSVDNLFVFIVIFDYFKVDEKLQSRVLNYGILGAILFRFIFVFLGAELLMKFDFLILLFAGILLYASFKGFSKDEDDEEENLEDSFIYRSLSSVIEIGPSFDGENFFTQISGRTVATPLLLCLLVIEFSDIVFATDSVPAVLGTTQDAFIAYSSNIFAVFGLRSLFFILRDAMNSFSYLEPAVNTVLGWIGLKIILDYFNVVEIPILGSLALVLGILATGIGLSIRELSNANAAKAQEDGGEHS